MDYQNFLSAVERGMEARLPEEFTVSIHTTVKNNGLEKKGITIGKRDVNISPTIYMEEFYKQYKKGEKLEDIIKKIDHFYHEVRYEKSLEMDFITDFSDIKKKIVFKLINKEKNEALLKTIPYVEFQDLALVFYLLLDVKRNGCATMIVNNYWMKQWGISVPELYDLSQKNVMRLLPATFTPMQEVLDELMYDCQNELYEDSEEDANGCNEKTDMMYVLTNEVRNLGAAVIAYDHILEMVADELKKDFYILPSSIHEVIIIPASASLNRDEIDSTILEINETQVEPEEVLQSHAYYYDRVGKRLYF